MKIIRLFYTFNIKGIQKEYLYTYIHLNMSKIHLSSSCFKFHFYSNILCNGRRENISYVNICTRHQAITHAKSRSFSNMCLKIFLKGFLCIWLIVYLFYIRNVSVIRAGGMIFFFNTFFNIILFLSFTIEIIK